MKLHCRTFNISLTNAFADMDDEVAVNEFMQQVHVSKVYASIVNDRDPYWSILVFYSDEPISSEETFHTPSSEKSLPERTADIILTPEEDEVYQALRQWRNQRADEEGLKPYIIAHNRMLKEIVRFKVTSTQDLLDIRGFGSRRVEKYGDDIMAIMQHFTST